MRGARASISNLKTREVTRSYWIFVTKPNRLAWKDLGWSEGRTDRARAGHKGDTRKQGRHVQGETVSSISLSSPMSEGRRGNPTVQPGGSRIGIE